MGWYGSYCTKPGTRKEQAELLCRLFYEEGFQQATRVLEHRLIKGVWYAKVETTKEDGSVVRWFAICLVRWEKGQVMRKLMDNTMGPYADDCPVRWFDDVPVEGAYDREWRDRCFAKQAKRRRSANLIKTMEAGDRVKFDTLYAGADEWIYTGTPWLFCREPHGFPVRLRKWKQHIQCITKQHTHMKTIQHDNRQEVHHA